MEETFLLSVVFVVVINNNEADSFFFGIFSFSRQFEILHFQHKSVNKFAFSVSNSRSSYLHVDITPVFCRFSRFNRFTCKKQRFLI